MAMTIVDEYITQPRKDNKDGITVFGADGIITLVNCTVDFSNLPLSEIDEAFSGVYGAQATVAQCNFKGAGKLLLWGSGDTPELDKSSSLYMNNCILEEFGRRGPEAQDGATVTLYNCTIRNWGIKDRFDTRAFGAWAHHDACINAVDCIFEQDSFFQTGFLNFFKDIFNHIGQAINDRGVFGLSWKDFIPGVCRGLTASDGGVVRAIDCKKNKWWIRIENNRIS